MLIFSFFTYIYNVGVFSSFSHVCTTVCLHHLNTHKMSGEKVTWELLKNAVCCFKQILEAAPYKTAAVQPLTFHLITYIGNMSKT